MLAGVGRRITPGGTASSKQLGSDAGLAVSRRHEEAPWRSQQATKGNPTRLPDLTIGPTRSLTPRTRRPRQARPFSTPAWLSLRILPRRLFGGLVQEVLQAPDLRRVRSLRNSHRISHPPLAAIRERLPSAGGRGFGVREEAGHDPQLRLQTYPDESDLSSTRTDYRGRAVVVVEQEALGQRSFFGRTALRRE